MDETQAAYEKFAAQFDAMFADMPPSLVQAATRFLELLPANPHVLDVGCGPGRDMAWLEARGATMTGVDFSTEMLKLARTRVQGHLEQMDMRALRFADSSFDGVWCNAALLHVPKLEAPSVLTRFFQMLKPGGVAFVSMQLGSTEQLETHRVYPDVQRFFARYAPAEFLGLLESNGFQVFEHELEDAGNRSWIRVLARKLERH